MSRIEAAVLEVSQQLLPKFTQLGNRVQSLINVPLEKDTFDEKDLTFQWTSLIDNDISSENFDSTVDLICKKIIQDSLVFSFDEASNESESYRIKTNLCAVVLDFIFHSRANRKNQSNWGTSFFDIFATVIELLSLPQGILAFWPYAESRINWFKMSNTDESTYSGISTLVSYKNPLSEKLRHWNSVLEILENNSKINSPEHFEVKYKLQKFLSDLLPLHEESNFNRSSSISRKQLPDSPWNKARSNTRPTSNHEIFTDDYLYAIEKFITDPIEFSFRSFTTIRNVNETLNPLIDAILEHEEDFYKIGKHNTKTVANLNSKLNDNYEADFQVANVSEPSYMSQSRVIQEKKKEVWGEITAFFQQKRSIPRPTIIDLAVGNAESLYKQIVHTENDIYRKEIILQICFVAAFIEKLINSEEIENFFKTCYQKDNNKNSLRFDEIDETNKTKILSTCKHLCENRILNFYATRDPTFHSIIKKLLESDDRFLLAKIDGFKSFAAFKFAEEDHNVPEIDKSFKKFGFIKLGNKQINNVWKINSGLETISEPSTNPGALYERLRSNWEMKEPTSEEEKDRIVREWQTLRSLRSQFLFEFKKFNEVTGTKGFFDDSATETSMAEKEKTRKLLHAMLHEEHEANLRKAREYIKEREQNKKRRNEEMENSNDIQEAVGAKKMKSEKDLAFEGGQESAISGEEIAESGVLEVSSTEQTFDDMTEDKQQEELSSREGSVAQSEQL
ncbi:hypothetical protein KAFR_0B05650 [Kazachstania africana CBS 2517]|uniref:THO complex subunit HPR1 n=1 Tax=Kazachstania africana (strain ATCC 22294 / BCRC 22015 / CBS 2517 / CECT 1963 / NBRC 1671 / NRRL Y-8276) TaxID=1071382 RepID=H2AR61_KAZAF|nr:hypothetical protein KAFR_0B05650 [Kazachstania africana CBS 2517]CCF56861.1 hypothetical protein KAFR_0B05650 [Kazachstania africana CBS 2517]